MQVPLDPFLRKLGRHIVLVSFKSVTRFTVIRQMAVRVQSRLSAAIENDAIASV